MSNTVRLPMSKPQRARLVLVAATSFVAVTLLAWLLIWFVNQQPRIAPVVVLYQTLNRDDIGHIEADARALAGKQPTKVEPEDLTDQILQKLAATPPPRVLVLSASALGKTLGGRETIEQIVARIAGKARKDLLIVLDLAQVDTDRALHVYGNAPYAGLNEALKKIVMKKDDPNVAVLCSAAPGQVSWASDGIGRSVFSYFLQHGLAGAARSAPDPAARRPRPGKLTPDDIHRYVHDQVRDWTRINRKANQTPILLAVGKSSTSFKIPALAVNPPTFSESSVAESTSSEEAKAKATSKAEEVKGKDSEKEKKIADKPAESSAGKRASTPADPRKDQLVSLIAEWRQYHELAKNDPPPYRYVPTLWREYQDELLRADRLLRAGWADPLLREIADDQLTRIAKKRDDLVAKFESRKNKEDEFRFRPAKADNVGSTTVNEALKFVTGQGVVDLIVESEPPVSGVPAKAAGVGNVAGELARRPEVAGKSAHEAPGTLSGALYGVPPERYLELQLPAYAHGFVKAFSADILFKGERGRLLRDAVVGRLPGELALFVDRRGLDRVREPIQTADRTRREVQDTLLGGSIENLETPIATYRGKYQDALGLITEYHTSRTLLERIAAEFPALAEWKVRSTSRTVGAVGGGLPEGCDEVVRTARALADALEAGQTKPESAELNPAFTAAREAFERLSAEFQRKARVLNNDVWRDLDDILRVPLVDPELREKLLSRVLKLETELPRATASGTTDSSLGPTSYPADPGFRLRAIWLARLDAGLYELAFRTHLASGTREKLKDLRGDLESPPGDDPKALDDFLDLTAKVSKNLKELSNEPGPPDLTPQTTLTTLEAADLHTRFRPPTDQYHDEAVNSLDDYARRSALEFHAARLNEDYADTTSVKQILLAARRNFNLGPNPLVRLYDGTLNIKVEPQTAAITALRKVELKVRLEPQAFEGGLQSRDVAPEGKAFVGVSRVVPPPVPPEAGAASPPPMPARLIVSVMGDPTALFLPNGLSGGIVPVPKNDPQINFEVRQVDSALNKNKTAELRVQRFYRGRLDEAEVTQKVALLDFGDDLKISLRQNKQALASRFGDVIAKRIGDQFAEHPDRGYFHTGEQVDFDVVITNISPGALKLRVKRTYTPENGEGTPRILIEESRELKSNEEWPLIGSVTAAQAPVGKPLVLKVEVFKEGVAMPQTEKFGFEQMKVDQYITVTPRQGETILNGKPELNALILDIKRLASDRCRDPIFFKDIEAEAVGKKKKRSLSPDDYLDRDESVEAGWPIEKTDKEIEWRVTVGKGEPFIRKYMIK